MKPPTAYSEWVACLDVLASESQDDEVLYAMENGTLEWTSGVAERLTTRLYETADRRLTRAADLLQRDLNRAGGVSADIVRAILGGRRRIALVMRIASLPALPDYAREHLTAVVGGYAEKAQQSMEATARQDRSGKALSLLRSNSISNFGAVEHAPDECAPSTNPFERPRRPIIFP
jgi:hypothetical protein